MAVKSFNPTTPTLRYKTVSSFDEITKRKPEIKFVAPKKSQNFGFGNISPSAATMSGEPPTTILVESVPTQEEE